MYRKINSVLIVLLASFLAFLFASKVNASSQTQPTSLNSTQSVSSSTYQNSTVGTSMQSNQSTSSVSSNNLATSSSNSVSSISNSVAKTNSTVIQSVNNVSTSSASMGATEILNIILIAVGVIITLLAIAITNKIKIKELIFSIIRTYPCNRSSEHGYFLSSKV